MEAHVSGCIHASSANPPTGGGLAIEVSTIGFGGTQLLSDYIAAPSWRALGTPPGSAGYSFRFYGGIVGHCGRGVIRDGVIRLACDNLDAAVPWTGDAAVTVTVSGGNPATDRKVYCGLFGGTEVRNDSIMLKRVRAPAPAVCPPTACGNGTREPQEPCDGADTGSVTCVGLGFSGGTLACNPGCFSYDTSGCTP